MSGRHIKDQQLRLYMQNREKHSVPVPVPVPVPCSLFPVAAAKPGFSSSTGYRIEADPRPPSEKKVKHKRRRPDPLAGIFTEEVVPMLQSAPDLLPVGILRELCKRHPELGAGIRRTSWPATISVRAQ